jgi:hypothetical protein
MTAGTPRTLVSTLYSASMDSELELRLANFLNQRGVPGADCIRLDAHGGVVAVSGGLPTRYAKWLCIECCRRVAGVIKVIDNMKIQPAISELPKAVHMAAQPLRHRQIRRYTYRHINTNEWATSESVAAGQHPRLLAAA